MLLATGVVGSAAAFAPLGIAEEVRIAEPPTPAPAIQQTDVPLTLTPTEWAFVGAVADVMIPADDLTPSGSDLGIPLFIDRQLAGAFGSGARLYRSGPFVAGKPEQGYQLPLTPREYFSAGISLVNKLSQSRNGMDFDRLTSDRREGLLKDLEAGAVNIDPLSSTDFFEALLAIVLEGFFSDPVYGGNRGKASWKMIGFPGLPALYADKMERFRGTAYLDVPQSISELS